MLCLTAKLHMVPTGSVQEAPEVETPHHGQEQISTPNGVHFRRGSTIVSTLFQMN